jgi:hypothetical protein
VNDVRRFFKDLGTINRINIFPGEDSTKSASVEFEKLEDAEFAQSRSGKKFKGAPVRVSLETSSTLWVSNYPAAADEPYIKDLFKDYGEIAEIRFPSLKFNTHRRFCYVQFTTAEQAVRATTLNGKELEDGLKLVAKISDPSLKTERVGAVYEGREVFVGNVDFDATEPLIKDQDLLPHPTRPPMMPANMHLLERLALVTVAHLRPLLVHRVPMLSSVLPKILVNM